MDRLPGLVGGRDPRTWFHVEEIDPGTFVIGEHRYWQRNRNHLLVGSERALLVDTGPGLSDLAAVVRALTDRPVTVLATHLHWDHIGGHDRFGDIAAPDVPAVRAAAHGDVVRPPLHVRLAPRPRPLRVTTWLAPGARIDLGDRVLTVHHAPGHTEDSVVVHEPDRGLLLTGDLLYDGPMAFGLLPGTDLATARRTAERLTRDCPARLVLGGHYGVLDGRRLPAFAAALAAVDDDPPTGAGRLVRRVRLDGFDLVLGPAARRRDHRW